ncbi:hypothetical protein HF086_011155 [Spodoptera exigua]|uniref:BEN domain-containing protein n=1 Tax=Spodoptera exigua TaxID=7107 RepID=A0A922MUB7_SPOEX|nr:hypothetical protein HF086_011155 [Spodoptera exigua]
MLLVHHDMLRHINCPWDAENIIRVESSKKIQAELEALQVLPSKPNAAQENKPKTKSKMNMRDELTQSLKRKVSECNRNIKAARIESATDVPEPTSNLSISEKKSVFCKDLAVKISRLPEIFVTKSKLSGLTDSEQENTNNTSCDKKMHSHHTEPGTSSGNCHRRTSDSEVDVTTSSSSSSLLQILKETPGPSYTRKNSSTSGTSSQSGQLTANTTQNASTISSSQKLDSKVSKQSISNPSKTDVNPPLQININNPPAKAERRQSVKKSTDVNTSNKIENYPNVTPQDKRLLQDFIASGGLQGVDHVYLESCLKYLQENTQVMQNAPVAPPNTQGLHLAPQMSPQALQAAQVVPLAMQAVEATPQTKQDEQATLQPMQATKSTPLPAQASQIALKAMLAEQVAPKRAINTPPGSLSYPITANTPALYQDPHERQITSERSSKKNDPTYSQSRARNNVSNFQNMSNLNYFPPNQDFGNSQHRQTLSQIAGNEVYANNQASGRISDRFNTSYRPMRPTNNPPLNDQISHLQQRHYPIHTAPLRPNMPHIYTPTSPKNQLQSHIQMPHLPQQNFAINTVPIAPKMPQTSKQINTMPNIQNPNHPRHTSEYSYHDRYQGYNYSHFDVEMHAQHLMRRSGTGHNQLGLGAPTTMTVNTQHNMHTYPPSTNQFQHRAQANNTVIPAYANYSHQVKQVQENIRPRSNDRTYQVSQRHEMPQNIPTAAQQISNAASSSNDENNSTNILTSINQVASTEIGKNKTDGPTAIIEKGGENVSYAVESPNSNIETKPSDSVKDLPVCNDITTDDAVPKEIEQKRSSSADTIKIEQRPNTTEDLLSKLTNKCHTLLSPSFREQVEVNLIKHFGKIFQIMSDNFGEILQVLSSNRHMIKGKKKMLDKALSSIALYLELRNENSATALPSKQLHTSASKKITKKKKIKKRERKGVNNEGGCNDSSDDSDSHNNDDSDTSDDDFVKNIKRNIKSNPRNSCKGNKLDDKGGTSSSNGNKQSDGKTHKAQDVKETADSDGDKNFKSDSNNPTDEPKRRGKKYPFVLPREYSPTNSRWTLLHQKKTYINKELLPKSRIYVHANKLAHVKRISNNYKEFARMLLTLIFTRKALRVCSWTGARANAFAVDENDVRPGLDENARQVMLTYVERFGRKKGWGIYDEQSVVNSVRAKIQDFRRIYTRQLMNKPKQ